jgi:hypothetical protein
MDAMQEYMNNVYASPYGAMRKKLYDNNYIRLVFQENCLYDDELWVHPDTIKAYIEGTHNPKYIFVYKDKYLNAWSSTQTQRRYSKLCQWQIQVLSDNGLL